MDLSFTNPEQRAVATNRIDPSNTHYRFFQYFSSVHEQELGRDNLLYTCSHVSTCSLDLDQSSTVTSLLNSKSLNRFTGVRCKDKREFINSYLFDDSQIIAARSRNE